MTLRSDLRQALMLAAPVMLAYVSIGIPCGVMEAEVGFTPLQALLFSATYYSGAGQFMVPGLRLVATPLSSIFLGVSLVTTRQLLYSAAFAPYVGGERLVSKLAFASLVTDETFGVNLERYESREGWDLRRSLLVNICAMLSWATANGVGAALGAVLDLPVSVMSFGMTAIFICLLVGQRWNRTGIIVAISTVLVVVVCKACGMGGLSVFVGAVAGVVSGVVFGAEKSEVSA